jgi:hypothetical protein
MVSVDNIIVQRHTVSIHAPWPGRPQHSTEKPDWTRISDSFFEWRFV